MRAGRGALPAMLALLAAVLASCSDSSEPATPDAAPRQVARFALGSQPDSFDPQRVGASTANSVLQRQVYEGLTEYDYLARPPETRPLLAGRLDSREGDFLWTIRLREDARFYDPEDPPLWPGRTRPVKASDVVYSWLRQADTPGGSGAWWVFEGLIAGLDEFHDALVAAASSADPEAERERIWSRALSQGVKGLSVANDLTLLVTLQRPAPELHEILASPYAVVVPREAVERDGARFGRHPVGSGPFYLAEWREGGAAVFRRTPGWRGQKDPLDSGMLPHLDELRFTYVAESSTRELLFRQGEIDRYAPEPGSLGSVLKAGELDSELAARGVELQVVANPNLTFLGFNMRDPVVGSVPGDEEGNARRLKLRQAMALVFPYERFMRLVRSGLGAEPAWSFLPPQLPESLHAPRFPWRRDDLAQARRLLEEAGWPGGEGLPVLHFEMASSSTSAQDIAALLVDALASVGIRCEAVPNTYSAFVGKARKGEAQLFLWLWVLDWPDVNNVMQLFYGDNAAPGDNFCSYADAEFDRLFREYRSALPGPGRTAKAHGMLERLYADVPAVPIDVTRGFVLSQPWLKNHRIHPFDPYAAKYYRIEGR